MREIPPAAVLRYVTAGSALAGMADTGQFLAVRRHLFRENRRRGAGTAAGLVLWSALALSAALDRSIGARTLGLASAVTLANTGLLAVHLRSRLRSPRIFLGPALGAAALAASLAGARSSAGR